MVKQKGMDLNPTNAHRYVEENGLAVMLATKGLTEDLVVDLRGFGISTHTIVNVFSY